MSPRQDGATIVKKTILTTNCFAKAPSLYNPLSPKLHR
nr:MAG TPA: hypothetical protein [Caudoviricetes sp.]